MADEQKEKLSGEARVDAMMQHLKDKHGFVFPEEIAPDEASSAKPRKSRAKSKSDPEPVVEDPQPEPAVYESLEDIPQEDKTSEPS